MTRKPTAAPTRRSSAARTRAAALAAETAVFPFTAVEPLDHGVRVRPKPLRTARGTTGAGAQARMRAAGPVEVRVRPDAGSKTWRELVTLVTAAAVDRLAGVPEPERVQLLADLRETLSEEGMRAASAEVLAALRRAAGGAAPPADGLPPANRTALDRAFARAEATAAEILSRPDMLTGEELAKRVGLARATVDNRRRANQLLALELGAKRGVRYPDWQVALLADAATRKAFETALAELEGAGQWSKYRFFTTASPALGGRTPVAALEAGDAKVVERAAGSWAAGEQGGH